MSAPSIDLDLDYLPKLPQDKSPGIGCIGSGFIMADCHLVAYANAGFRPVAISSRTKANAESVAARHGIGKVYADYRDLLDDREQQSIEYLWMRNRVRSTSETELKAWVDQISSQRDGQRRHIALIGLRGAGLRQALLCNTSRR